MRCPRGKRGLARRSSTLRVRAWVVLQICTVAATEAILASSRAGGHAGPQPCALPPCQSEPIMRGAVRPTPAHNAPSLSARLYPFEFISICSRSSRGSRTYRTSSSTSVGCGSTLSIAGSSAVAASKIEAAYSRWAAAIGCGTSVVPSIMLGSSSPWAADD
jgi:hypothetical protein